MTHPEELHARALLESLKRRFCNTNVVLGLEGRGVHWHVHVEEGARLARIHCFDLGPSANQITLGVRGNAHLSKVRVGPVPLVWQGADYFLDLRAQAQTEATARTQDLETVSRVAHDWVLAQVELNEMYVRHEVVDERRRKNVGILKAVNDHLAALDSKVRVVLDDHPSEREHSELWVYAGDRSCTLVPGSQGLVSWGLLLKRTQLVRGHEWPPAEVARMIRLWVDDAGTVAALRGVSGAIEFGPYAEEFDRGDFSSWHWGNVLLQAENDAVLDYYRPLVVGFAGSRVARPFFSFTSLNRLCLSRSSLYPFDTEGLPRIIPAQTAERMDYTVVCRGKPVASGAVPDTLACVEDLLAHETVVPYFGTLEDRLCNQMNSELCARGSPLRARPVQKREWQSILIQSEKGNCELSGAAGVDHVAVRFLSKDSQAHSFVGDVASAAAQVIAWLGGL